MISEMPPRVESGILAQIRKSNTRISTKLTTVRLENPRATMLEIRPRDVGTDFEGWEIEGLLGTQTLEEAIILCMEIQARECLR
jgi:hypothetical protein